MNLQAAHYNPVEGIMGYDNTLEWIMAQMIGRAFGGMCIDGACPAWDVSWSTDRPYQKKPLRPLPLVEDPFEHIGMESRLGQIAPRPKLGNGGQWRDVWCQGRFSIAWPRLPYFSRMPRPGEGVLHRKRWLKSLMSRKQIVNKRVYNTVCFGSFLPHILWAITREILIIPKGHFSF